MPVPLTSRYRGLVPYHAPDAAGVHRATVPARFPPPGPPSEGATYFHTVQAGETIEWLAHRYLGSSEAWWQIADANPGLFPTQLTPGSQVAIPTDGSPGLVVRTRTF